MTELEANKWLEETFCAEYQLLEENFPIYRGGFKGSLKTYSRCKLSKMQTCIETDCNLYSVAWDRIGHCEKGTGFPCALVADEENYMVLVGGSGAARMNPAVVELLFGDNRVELTAWAKEGIIKQKTAQKALEACVRALRITPQE